MDTKTLTIEEAEEIIRRQIAPCDSEPFVGEAMCAEDLYNIFYDTVKNPTGDLLLETFEMFYLDEDLQYIIEGAMLNAAYDVITRKIKELKTEE